MVRQIVARLETLLQGKIPEKFALEATQDPELGPICAQINTLIDCLAETHAFILPLSRGALSETPALSVTNFLSSPFKELRSRLLHLSWQAQQVAQGDFSQRVDFMGDFSTAFNAMVCSLAEKEAMLEKQITSLEQALLRIQTLEDILPICSHCKKIRLEGTDPEEAQNWLEVESYFSRKTQARFSHSICPECLQKYYSELIG